MKRFLLIALFSFGTPAALVFGIPAFYRIRAGEPVRAVDDITALEAHRLAEAYLVRSFRETIRRNARDGYYTCQVPVLEDVYRTTRFSRQLDELRRVGFEIQEDRVRSIAGDRWFRVSWERVED